MAAALALLVALCAVALGLLIPAQPDRRALKDETADTALYARVIDEVRSGENYYVAVARDLRQEGGALRPFVTVRLPTVAVAMAALPAETMRVMTVRLLAVAVIVAWAFQLLALGLPPRIYLPALLLLMTGVAMAFAPQAYLMHETWAGLLISLSLALRRPQVWVWSVLAGLAAALVRELSIPYLLVMALMALRDGRPRETAGWAFAIGLAAVALLFQANAVHGVLLPTDATSPGWLSVGGWPFVLHAASWNVLAFDSRWLVAILFPAALFGLGFWRDATGRRVAFTVLGYTAGFMLIGRPVNFYWGLMIAPLWPLGLAMVPVGLKAVRPDVRPSLQATTA